MSETGSIESTARLESYKIDQISFVMAKEIHALASNLPTMQGNLTLNFGKPQFSKTYKKYIITLAATLTLPAPAELLQKIDPNSTEKDKSPQPLATCAVSIAGLFSIDGEDKLDKNTLASLLKWQFPQILLPYLRSTITMIMVSSGFGFVALPLINMQAVAKNQPADIEIQYID